MKKNLVEKLRKLPARNFKPDVEAALLLIEHGGRIFLQLRPSKASSFPRTLALVAGKLHENESAGQAALREALEETGLQLSPQQLTDAKKLRLRQGKKNVLLHLFRVKMAEKPEIAPNPKVSVANLWLTPREAHYHPQRMPGLAECVREYYRIKRR